MHLPWFLVAGLLLAVPAFADEVGPDPDAPAVDPGDEEAPPPEASADGVWSWVARMEGEVPDPETVEAAEERFEEQLAERALVEDLGGGDAPIGFYTDPAAELAVDPLHLDRIDPSEFDIPIVVNDEVLEWLRYFTGPGRKYYTRWLQRSTAYRPMMYRELEAAGMPADLVYLSMIESGYNAHAYSHAHAVGLWQFIPATGRLYDLRVDWWVDERRDPYKSTKAAIAFLAELHEMFGSWELAWAGYNGGPGRVRRAIARAKSEDFWTLAAGSYLHSETDNYVPKIMAAAIIGKHPERYGFTDVAFEDEFTFETAVVEGSVEVAVLARAAGLGEDAFRHLNPALRRWATPSGKTDIRVPVGSRDAFVAALERIPVSERVAMSRHKVRRGETLSLIAGRYGVSVSDLVRVNQLRNADRIVVGMTLIVPGGSEQVAALATPASTTRATDAAPARPRNHTVRAGDTLSEIAGAYGLSVADVQRYNGLKGTTIHVGQVLALQATATEARPVRYTVRRGDTLSAIAARYGVTAAQVQRDNQIRNASHITVGQVLTLHVGDTGWKTYRVRAGDSLGAIGTRHGCSVGDLVAWNDLSSTVIHPGQELRIQAR